MDSGHAHVRPVRLDPITGQGISHAFRDAELLADAVADGFGGIRPLGEALGRYHRARDRAARPMYDFTARLAAIVPPRSAEMALFQALARRQEDADQFAGVLTGSVPLRQFMSPRTMVRLVGVRGFARPGAALRFPATTTANRLDAIQAVEDLAQRGRIGGGRISLDGLGPVSAGPPPGERCPSRLISGNRLTYGWSAVPRANGGNATAISLTSSPDTDKRHPHAGRRKFRVRW